MSSPHSTFTELVSTTARNRRLKVRDNVSKSIALLYRLQEKGNIDYAEGGRTLVEEIEYAENAGFQWYDGWEQLSTTRRDVISAFEYEWKQAACPIQISGKEMRMNAGKMALIKLLKARMKNAETTTANQIGAACYAAGTGNGGKEFGGLQLLVADAPSTGVVGGVDRATWTFAQNKSRSCLTDGGFAASAANIVSNANALYVQLKRNNERPDLGILDAIFWLYYLESLQPQQRFTNQKLADAGFDNIRYMSMDCVLDGGYEGSCPSSHWYMLNTNYLKLRPHPDCEYDVLGGEREPVNQDGIIKYLGYMGNLTCSNFFLQGVLKA